MASDEKECAFTAKFFNGRYGPEHKTGKILVSEIVCYDTPSKKVDISNKELIIVVDLSSSMGNSIPHLRASLLALKDSLLEIVDKEQNLDVKLLGYSDTAWEIYPEVSGRDRTIRNQEKYIESFLGRSTQSAANNNIFLDGSIAAEDDPPIASGQDQDKILPGWEGTIKKEIKTYEMTNMGAGIELAFQKTSKKKCTWIVVMTDGHSNRGQYQTLTGFEDLMGKIPPLTKVISLGYGNEFNCDILQAIGEFTYVESAEIIPSVLGSIINEFVFSWGFDAKFEYNGSLGGLTSIIGQHDIGCLYQEREFVWAGLTEGETVENNELAMIYLSYTNISDLSESTVIANIDDVGGDLHEYLRERYYAAAKGRRLMKIYSTPTSKLREVVLSIKEDLDSWKEDCAASHKAELLRIIETFEKGDTSNLRYTTATRATDSQRQYSNTVTTEYTPTQNRIASRMSIASDGYI